MVNVKFPRPIIGSYGWSDERKHRRTITNELRDQKPASEYEPTEDTDLIVVLSAAPEKQGEEIIEKSSENIVRIKYAVEIAKKLIAKRLKTTIEAISSELLFKYGPQIMINGETEQLPSMKELVEEFGYPGEKVIELDCGKRGVGNTQTQFTEMQKNLNHENFNKIVFITNAYHKPRVLRTARKNMPGFSNYDIVGIVQQEYPVEVNAKAKSEIRRILTYSKKGDIAQ